MGSDGTIYATPEAYQASLKPEQKAQFTTHFSFKEQILKQDSSPD